MRKKIVVVHNSDRVSPVIGEALDEAAFELMFLSGFSDVITSVLEFKPALILFDITCWEKALKDPLTELMNLKSGRSARKVILSEAAGLDDKVNALELGADDFLLKPISSRELLVRLSAALRSYMPPFEEDDVKMLGDLALYSEAKEISIGKERKKLSPKEFDLLCFLMDHPGQVFSREELLENVWIPWEIEDRRVVDVYIWRLREKIETDPSKPRILLTRRGHGYSLVAPMNSSEFMSKKQDS
jgi:two-component system, OmpR family, response regulator VicR